MKIITFVVPCYNSAAYMDRCVDSLLPGGKDIEIILVNDGSTDETPLICERYAADNPDVVRVIHQENGGHGEGVNQGIRHAHGLYFKVVDSDDWLDGTAMQSMLDQLQEFSQREEPVDLVVCNYIYDHALDNAQKVMKYDNVLPQACVFSWQDCGRIRLLQYLMMHSLAYRTEVLRGCGLILPKHTFYVDTLYAYIPLPYVKTIFYIDLDLYHYFIGRSDQSVNERVMVTRVSQQIKVSKLMLESHDLSELSQSWLAKYMSHYLSLMFTISSMLLVIDGSPESDEMSRDMWLNLKNHDKDLYYKYRYFSLPFLINLDRVTGNRCSMNIYRLAQKVYHFN